jgi:mRNA interferase MazF
MVIKRGDIWWAELPEPQGSGPGYKRPLVVIQSNEFNESKINTVIAAVITTNIRISAAPGNILLSKKKSKLPKESVINVSQIITVDKTFLTERVKSLSSSVMKQVDEGMRLVLNLN